MRASLSRHISGAVRTVRLRGPLAGDPTAQVFHGLLVALFVWVAFATIVTLPFSPITVFRIAAVLTLEVALAVALAFLHIGWFRRAGLVYLAGTWLFATIVMAFNGGIRSPVQILYVSLPISAAWLLGYGGALWTTGVCLATALVFAVLEITGVPMPVRIPGTPFGVWAVLLVACLIGAVPVAQVLRALRAALNQSRASEQELTRYQSHLEELVEQRTADLVQARDEAQAANRAKSVFLANMSHDFRTPLSAILGFSGLARDRASSEEQSKDIDAITRSGEHLLALINDALDMATIESGGAVLRIESLDLGALVRDAAAMMRARAEQKHLELVVEAPAFPLPVRVDAAKLRRILINLLGNAIRYTETGSVTLRVKSGTDVGDGRVHLTFEVEDTGIGVAAEDHSRIFDPFVQLGASRKQRGAGLGLTITRHLVDLMGGTVHLESTPGFGSLFRVELTVERAPESEVTGPQAEPGRVIGLDPGQPEYRVLIVEDEEDNWIVLERLLRNAGFQVRVAKDGAEGVECYRAWRPHFIWMDVLMPVVDGIEATRRIRSLPGGREVKIAALTALEFSNRQDEVPAAGLDDYVRKPYRPEDIFDCMERHLGLRYHRGDATSLPAGESREELGIAELAALPADLRAGLRESLVALDVGQISEAIQRVAGRDSTLGAVFERLASRYAYTAMLDAIDAAENRSAATRS